MRWRPAPTVCVWRRAAAMEQSRSGVRGETAADPGRRGDATMKPVDVAQALVPAVSRLVSTRFARATPCWAKSVPMSGDAAGRRACAPPHHKRWLPPLLLSAMLVLVTGAQQESDAAK